MNNIASVTKNNLTTYVVTSGSSCYVIRSVKTKIEYPVAYKIVKYSDQVHVKINEKQNIYIYIYIYDRLDPVSVNSNNRFNQTIILNH